MRQTLKIGIRDFFNTRHLLPSIRTQPKMTASLLDFCEKPKKQTEEEPAPSTFSKPEEAVVPLPEKKPQPAKEKVVYPDFPEDLPPSYLVSVSYDGKKQLATLGLYEPLSQKIYFWDDNTGHKPYLLTSLLPQELKKLSRVTGHSGFDHFETVEKFDPLLDKHVTVTKVVAKDPLAIGGRQSGCMRDIIHTVLSVLHLRQGLSAGHAVQNPERKPGSRTAEIG
jgi:hypothetical protein